MFKIWHMDCSSFRKEFERGAIIKCLYFKKMNTIEIHKEFALRVGNDASIPASVHHWLHAFKIGRVSIKNDPRPGSSPLDDIDIAILKKLLRAPFSSLRRFSEDLSIPRVTLWVQMTNSLRLQCGHFKQVSSMITEELRRK
jgi:hypothetical protein